MILAELLKHSLCHPHITYITAAKIAGGNRKTIFELGSIAEQAHAGTVVSVGKQVSWQARLYLKVSEIYLKMEFQLCHWDSCHLIREIKRARARCLQQIPRGLAQHSNYKTYLDSVHDCSKQATFIELGLRC